MPGLIVGPYLTAIVPNGSDGCASAGARVHSRLLDPCSHVAEPRCGCMTYPPPHPARTLPIMIARPCMGGPHCLFLTPCLTKRPRRMCLWCACTLTFGRRFQPPFLAALWSPHSNVIPTTPGAANNECPASLWDPLALPDCNCAKWLGWLCKRRCTCTHACWTLAATLQSLVVVA